MSVYRALILDLDGTTVRSARDAVPSPRVKQAILAANQKIVVSIATGRPLGLCIDILKDLQIKQPCVAADYTAPGIDDDGVAEVIEKFIL